MATTRSERYVATSALSALNRLIAEDLSKATWTHEEAARTAFSKDPRSSTLLIAVKQLASALADVCRSHARECALIYSQQNDRHPVDSTMGRLWMILATHLRIPEELLAGDWPESNRLRDFIQHVSGAHAKLVNGEFCEWRLPRLEPRTRFARIIAGLPPDPPVGENEKFLSIAETNEELRSLEEIFRADLSEKLESSSAEATLVVQLVPAAPKMSANGKKREHQKGVIERLREEAIRMAINKGLRGLDYCRFMDTRGFRPRWYEGSRSDRPKTYVEGYQKGDPYQHWIQQEKSRVKRKMMSGQVGPRDSDGQATGGVSSLDSKALQRIATGK